MKWLRNREKVLFPPTNTWRKPGSRMGIQLDQMIVWDPYEIGCNHALKRFATRAIILWNGYSAPCTKRFTTIKSTPPATSGARSPASNPVHPRQRHPDAASEGRRGRRSNRPRPRHHQGNSGLPGSTELACWHRNSPRHPPQQELKAHKSLARSQRLRLHHHVPHHPPRSISLGARKSLGEGNIVNPSPLTNALAIMR